MLQPPVPTAGPAPRRSPPSGEGPSPRPPRGPPLPQAGLRPGALLPTGCGGRSRAGRGIRRDDGPSPSARGSALQRWAARSACAHFLSILIIMMAMNEAMTPGRPVARGRPRAEKSRAAAGQTSHAAVLHGPCGDYLVMASRASRALSTISSRSSVGNSPLRKLHFPFTIVPTTLAELPA